MADLEELYQDIVLEHNKRPRNYGPLAGATHAADGCNPLCGDELKISLRQVDGRIESVHFQGQGCAISRASASMMTQAVSGKPVDGARRIARELIDSLKPDGKSLRFEEAGDLAALSGVRRFPARIKCATLAWHALLTALDGGTEISTEEADDRR